MDIQLQEQFGTADCCNKHVSFSLYNAISQSLCCHKQISGDYNQTEIQNIAAVCSCGPWNHVRWINYNNEQWQPLFQVPPRMSKE